MKVRYIHESPLSGGGKQMSNIMWEGNWPMQRGSFPPDHPCVENADAFEQFKQRGYWASPFPEGDGITLDAKLGQSADQVVRDVVECFGWEVVNHPQ
jgi:hypothetical protein